jgi:hypothetical protein
LTEESTRFLHVANGTSTTHLIERSGLGGQTSIWADPLYEGPVPPGLSDEELFDRRARYHAGYRAGAADPANDMTRWRTVIESDSSYDELVLWFEHDLFDQINLIQLLTWVHERRPTAKPVSLVCVGSFPGRARFKGLGELTPLELASLFGTRRPVTDAQYTLASRAWQAFRAPTPEAVDLLRLGDTTALPYLAAALTRFLQEYPWAIDGLSRTERRLLVLADQVPSLRAVFPQMHEGEDAYYVTDSSLAAMAEELSRLSPPLLAFTPGDTDGTPAVGVLHGTVALTDTGRAVVAGRCDRVTTCGLDRWLGGVHLQSGAKDDWRWDDERGAMRRV